MDSKGAGGWGLGAGCNLRKAQGGGRKTQDTSPQVTTDQWRGSFNFSSFQSPSIPDSINQRAACRVSQQRATRCSPGSAARLAAAGRHKRRVWSTSSGLQGLCPGWGWCRALSARAAHPRTLQIGPKLDPTPSDGPGPQPLAPSPQPPAPALQPPAPGNLRDASATASSDDSGL